MCMAGVGRVEVKRGRGVENISNSHLTYCNFCRVGSVRWWVVFVVKFSEASLLTKMHGEGHSDPPLRARPCAPRLQLMEPEGKEGSESGKMAPRLGFIHRSGSRPQLDLTGAAIQGNLEERNPTIVLPNQSDDIPHLAIDIGGSLIKLLYFSRNEDYTTDDNAWRSFKHGSEFLNGQNSSYPILGGQLHFVKFETRNLNDRLKFIKSKQLHHGGLGFLGCQHENPLNEHASIKELFIGGIDATTATIEWAMAEFMKQPKIMAKIREELSGAWSSGATEGPELELKLKELPYFQACIKETMRLHPAVSLIPHCATETCEGFGYTIPKGCPVWVNVWAIGRDPASWVDPLTFLPERFIEFPNLDFKGADHQLIPFGSGRRICPGLPLATRFIELTLANLVHNFEWSLRPGMEPSQLSMEEKFGVTVPMKQPLQIIPKFTGHIASQLAAATALA